MSEKPTTVAAEGTRWLASLGPPTNNICPVCGGYRYGSVVCRECMQTAAEVCEETDDR